MEKLTKLGFHQDGRKLLESRTYSLHKINDTIYINSEQNKILISFQRIEAAPQQHKPNSGVIKFFGTEFKQILTKIYSNLINLRDFVGKKGESVEYLMIKVRIMESDGVPLNLIVDGINKLLENNGIFLKNEPKCFIFTCIDNEILLDPLRAEVGSNLLYVVVNGDPIFVETSGEWEYSQLKKCLEFSVENQ